MTIILTLCWLYLPLVFGNPGPVLAKKIPFLSTLDAPLDFGKTYKGKRIFGDHKTIRGIVAGTFMGVVAASLQMLLVANFDSFSSVSYGIDYSSPLVLLMGASIGFGAVAGDALKSFFKRQMSIEPGKSWVPFDQLDLVVGGFVFSLPFFVLPLHYYLVGVVLTLIIHPAMNVGAWLLRLQDKPF